MTRGRRAARGRPRQSCRRREGRREVVRRRSPQQGAASVKERDRDVDQRHGRVGGEGGRRPRRARCVPTARQLAQRRGERAGEHAHAAEGQRRLRCEAPPQRRRASLGERRVAVAAPAVERGGGAPPAGLPLLDRARVGDRGGGVVVRQPAVLHRVAAAPVGEAAVVVHPH
eukprot:1887969-Prymnesium_polylepis.1